MWCFGGSIISRSVECVHCRALRYKLCSMFLTNCHECRVPLVRLYTGAPCCALESRHERTWQERFQIIRGGGILEVPAISRGTSSAATLISHTPLATHADCQGSHGCRIKAMLCTSKTTPFLVPELSAFNERPLAICQRVERFQCCTQSESSLFGESIPQVHEPAYVASFCSGTLDEAAVRRIGFGEVVRSPVLVERTLAEVAGAPC